jgi:RNA 3'-terminal phosphate cyclase (ATP)
MLTIDGSYGEGGGQIIRTSLALSLITGKPFRIERVRARRAKPGLQRQHLTAVTSAAQVGRAEVRGAAVNSQDFSFVPGHVVAGDYVFSIGTAGSATLVLQTVLPPLMIAEAPSRITLEGGTHNVFAPPFDFLRETFLPVVSRTGPRITAELERYGFYPPGGGRFSVMVEPAATLKRLDLNERGPVRAQRARALVVKLPESIAERELAVIGERLGYAGEQLQVVASSNALSPGNVVMIEIESEHLTELISRVGERGVRAEEVARHAADEAAEYLSTEAPVGEHLADQLLIPLALAGGGSFTTGPPSLHTTTNIEIIRKFLDVEIKLTPLTGRAWSVEVSR